jgi:hypothetical protein
MSLKWMKASFHCDECGQHFWVELDPAYQPPDDWCLFDAAEDAIRAGTESGDTRLVCSVQDGRHLCHKCTEAEDALEECG